MLPLTPFYLMRHPETEANTQQLACGFLDSPLTAKGMTQAHDVAKILPQNIKMIYHSALTRTRHTAHMLASAQNCHTIERPALNEFHFGAWEGQKWDRVKAALDKNQVPPGGESNQQFIQRTYAALHSILTKHTHDTEPLIVAHGGTFHALGMIYQHMGCPIHNAALYAFTPAPEKPGMPWSVRACSAKGEKPVTLYTPLKSL
ncbi:histidine phosphatase family protein [bacterium NHP-B]|nr:histidine phosphatase family protein [bacterium NHP-B]